MFQMGSSNIPNAHTVERMKIYEMAFAIMRSGSELNLQSEACETHKLTLEL